MRLPVVLYTALAHVTASSTQETIASSAQQIAIVGGGAAGASAAYHLAQYTQQDGVKINITLFEKTDRIGGRTLTVNVHDDPLEPVELGASIFVKANSIMWNAADEFGLEKKSPFEDDHDELMVVWDGEGFVYQQSSNSWQWWQLLKMFWRYGRAPYRAQKLMQKTVDTFLQLYEYPNFPFRSLTTRVYELDLVKATGLTGEQFLAANNVDALFSHDLIQAATRVNYASNLDRIHGLETMVSIAPEGAVSIKGGNWRIFEGMVAKSKATALLNTSVTSISLIERSPSKGAAQYTITTKATDAAESSTGEMTFDAVIIANPYQYSGIESNDKVLHHAIEEVPYVRLHVTLFTTSLRLHYGFFGLSEDAQVPTTVLTTLPRHKASVSEASGVGKAGFYSISTLGTVVNPRTLQEEFLYKIFSPEAVKPQFLETLLATHIPETFVDEVNRENSAISWYYPHVFNSYAQGFPRVTFQDPIVGPGVYYTSGIEGFISTMETSALMGSNVARLIVDEILENTRARQTAQDAHDELR